MASANDSSRCLACSRFCSEIQALVEVANEFIAMDRVKAGAANFARMELMVLAYKRHIRQSHGLPTVAAATCIAQGF